MSEAFRWLPSGASLVLDVHIRQFADGIYLEVSKPAVDGYGYERAEDRYDTMEQAFDALSKLVAELARKAAP